RCRCPRATSATARSSATCTAHGSHCGPGPHWDYRPPSRCPSIPVGLSMPMSKSMSTTPSPNLRTSERGATNTMAKLEINDLHVSVDTTDGPKGILHGVDLTVDT